MIRLKKSKILNVYLKMTDHSVTFYTFMVSPDGGARGNLLSYEEGQSEPLFPNC